MISFREIIFAPKVPLITMLLGLGSVLTGLTVALYPQSSNVTVLAELHDLLPASPFLGTILVLVGVPACLSWLATTIHARLLMGMPQQLALTFMIYSSIESIYSGRYPDGYIPVAADLAASRAFIFNDQIWTLLFLVSLSIIYAIESVYLWRHENIDG